LFRQIIRANLLCGRGANRGLVPMVDGSPTWRRLPSRGLIGKVKASFSPNSRLGKRLWSALHYSEAAPTVRVGNLISARTDDTSRMNHARRTLWLPTRLLTPTFLYTTG